MKLILSILTVVVGLSSAPQAYSFSNSSPQVASSNSGLAVVLIDMQLGFYRRGGVIGTQGLNSLVLNQQKLLKWAKGNLIPVLVLQYDGFDVTDPNLMSIITKGRYRVIQKDNDGGFYGESHNEVLRTLKNWNVDTLIVAGINGPYCVKSTIEGALENGFNIMTTHYVIGNLNQNPPIYPNGVWSFKNAKLTIFPTLESIIRP